MREGQEGYALVTVLMLAALVAALLGAHFLLTRVDLSTTHSTMSSSRGFAAAEAGLNVRAAEVRKTFLGYLRPSGTAPPAAPGEIACLVGDPGTGDLACRTFTFGDRRVLTWVTDDLDDEAGPDEPDLAVIPPGEPFQGLTAQEYTYEVSSVALDRDGHAEAILEMQFKSRLVPLFQFAAFYDKDLEILPGPPMTLAGPVHTNGNLFLQSDAGGSLTIGGQVTLHGELFHGRKSEDTCDTGTVAIHDLSGPLALPPCAGAAREELLAADVDGTNPPHRDWQGMIHLGLARVDVPEPDALDPLPGRVFWDLADLRVLRDLTDAARPVKVMKPDGGVDILLTDQLGSDCPDAIGTTSGTLYNAREGAWIDTLEVDVQNLMDCIEHRIPNLMDGRRLDDATQGGLVWYFGVDDGVNAASPNSYGVRIRGGERLLPPGSPTDVRGLTIVTNQAVYIQGDFNEDPGADWRPAAILADSLNVLSNAWDDARSDRPLDERPAEDTTIRAAFLAGTDTTGGPAAEGLVDTDLYNGGLENYPRFHEHWQPPSGTRTLTYRGSFVSLDRPRRVDGPHTTSNYKPPARDWGYETRFNDAANLPPLTPRFVYLKQELFVRGF